MNFKDLSCELQPCRFFLSSVGVYKAAEARLLLLMYQVNHVNQGKQPKDPAITPAKLIEDSWTMDGFVSLNMITAQPAWVDSFKLDLNLA